MFPDDGRWKTHRGQFFKAGEKAKLQSNTGGRDLSCKDIRSSQFYSLCCQLSHLVDLRFPYIQSSLVPV